MRVVVMMGGTSSERDVSLASGLRIAAALRSRGHDVTSVDTVRGSLSAGDEAAMLGGKVMSTLPPEPAALARLGRDTLPATVGTLAGRGAPDVVFLALHGGQGEDGTLQALLDLTRVPYTGSGHLASALAMDKDLSKHLFRAAGVPTADWLMIGNRELGTENREQEFVGEVERQLGLPVVVKPSKQGSTVGLTVVRDIAQLWPAVE